MEWSRTPFSSILITAWRRIYALGHSGRDLESSPCDLDSHRAIQMRAVKKYCQKILLTIEYFYNILFMRV